MNKKQLLALIAILPFCAASQITTAVARAGFGVDGNLHSNSLVTTMNDDWFNNGLLGTGISIIDTTGASAMMKTYIANPATRIRPFVRYMNYPMFSVINGKLLYDGLFIRDHYDQDSTAFLSSNKNGMNPASWRGGLSKVPDKNEIKDVMVHLRRNGNLLTDSLWMIGALSLEGTTGNRYFDFELYQTEMYYDISQGRFFNEGPDNGHTAWQFDANGKVTRSGDIIFTAEYSSSSLTLLEARIWINKADMSKTPVNFNWGGLFDGPGGNFGYANIVPKTGGNYYTGMQCDANTWAGPFGNISLGAVKTTFDARQFMEFSVNLTKVGLDPYSLLDISSACKLPFKRLFVKTRTSTSFTSNLSDFIGPYSFGMPPAPAAAAELPLLCKESYQVSTISVLNPLPTSIYNWYTPDGNILTNPAVGSSILVDKAGSYILSQTLYTGCSPYAKDTIMIMSDSCHALPHPDVDVVASLDDHYSNLRITMRNKERYQMITVERSENNVHYYSMRNIMINQLSVSGTTTVKDAIGNTNAAVISYRVKITDLDGETAYSNIVTVRKQAKTGEVRVHPNPTTGIVTIQLPSGMSKTAVKYTLLDAMGRSLESKQLNGNGRMDIAHLPKGVYYLVVRGGGENITQKILKQ